MLLSQDTSHLHSTLAEYIRSMETEAIHPGDGLFPPDHYPTYAFDRSEQALRMLHDVGKLRFFNASRMDQVSFQWYLGPPGSGANDHYHGHAYNALLHGAKRWFLTPPPFAWYSRCEQPSHACVTAVQNADSRMWTAAKRRCSGWRRTTAR